MNDRHQTPKPLARLSEAAEAAEDTVNKCEQLHSERLAVYFNVDSHRKVVADCQRLHGATQKLLQLIEEQRWQMFKIAGEESNKRFETYVADAVRRLQAFGSEGQPASGARTAIGGHSLQHCIQQDASVNLIDIFTVKDPPSKRANTLQRELTHEKLMQWCIAFPCFRWSSTVASDALFADLMKWLKGYEALNLSWVNVNEILSKIVVTGRLKGSRNFTRWLQKNKLIELPSN